VLLIFSPPPQSSPVKVEEVKKNLVRGDVEIKNFFPLSPLLLQERVRVRSAVKF